MKYEDLREKSKSVKRFNDKKIQIGLRQVKGNRYRYKLDNVSPGTK